MHRCSTSAGFLRPSLRETPKMATSYGALCTDFYLNQKLALKLDLPSERETILHLFDRIRRSMPDMDRFRRYDGELALESSKHEGEYTWLALRRASIRTGHVNPSTIDEAHKLHQLILEVSPYHLTISPLDIDYIELMFGFDLECKGNHDEVIFDALFHDSPMANLTQVPGYEDARALDVQPIFGVALCDEGNLQAFFEIKTRAKSQRGDDSRYHDEPISLFLTVRQYGPIEQIDQLPKIYEQLHGHCETLASERLIPDLLTPIARQIISSST